MEDWKKFETDHFIVYCRDEDDLKVFDSNITYGNKWYKKIPLTERLEKMYMRTKRMLGTKHPKKKLEIKVHHNQADLSNTYKEMYLKENKTIRAWYNFFRNLICVNARTVEDDVLAHEIAHALTDHHFGMRPPRPMAEIIARYAGARF